MKRFCLTLFHFLGGVHFAVTLIGVTALFVIGGTLLESFTDSHRFAAFYTYEHPAFIALLALFFVNILFAALRRWPFRLRHIPFLITHLGLLMILGGTIVKKSVGVQGHLLLTEGSGSHELSLPNTQALSFKKRGGEAQYVFNRKQSPFQDLSVDLVALSPHSEEVLETWVKKGRGEISGLKSFPSKNFEPSGYVRLQKGDALAYAVYVVQTSDIAEAVRNVFLKECRLLIKTRKEGKIVVDAPLEVQLKKEEPHVTLDLSLSEEFRFTSPKLEVAQETHQVEVLLNGENALVNRNLSSSEIADAPITVDLICQPKILLLQGETGESFLFAFDPNGRVWGQPYRKEDLKQLVVYDEGYGGYAAYAQIPFPHPLIDRRAIESKQLAAVEEVLKSDTLTSASLAPPLQLLYHACQRTKSDFAAVTVQFFKEWNGSHSWFLPSGWKGPSTIQRALEAIDWSAVSEKEHKAMLWTSGAGFSPQGQEARLLTVYLRAYGLHLTTVIPPAESVLPPAETIEIETPLARTYRKAPPSQKLEENCPMVIFRCREKGKEETLTLQYDQTGSQLRWPILNQYLVRFEPERQSLPFHVRLRRAEKIHYPGSTQPQGYEASLLVTDRSSKRVAEPVVRMNHVHETWQGYRLYLANISQSHEQAPRKIQLVVNYDPAKYWLTYPGALIMALGVILLFQKLRRPS